MPNPYNRPQLTSRLGFAALALGFFAFAPGCASTGPPAGSLASPPLRSVAPDEPVFATEEQGTEPADRPAFNEFSWLDFVAVNWPAAEGRRGEPHPTKQLGDPADRVVWESWKSLDELSAADTTRPAARDWKDVDTPPKALWYRDEELTKKLWPAPIKDQSARAAGKNRLLHQVTRLTDIGQPNPNPDFLRPLVAQNKTFVRYEVRVNQTAYEFIRDRLGKESPEPLEFPAGSIHVKAAWMELPPDEEVRRRFYRVNATVVIDWIPGSSPTPVTVERVLGLVGLHIVHKTERRKDWIWSTFEHADNLLEELAAGAPSASFGGIHPAAPAYPGDNKPKPPLYRPGEPFPKEPTPVEVRRDPETPIPEATKDVNRRFREEHRQVKDTVWRYYKLVGTQWPVKGARTLGKPDARLPERLANTTMETYNQGISCMGCHSRAKASEFVFYPQSRRFDPEE